VTVMTAIFWDQTCAPRHSLDI